MRKTNIAVLSGRQIKDLRILPEDKGLELLDCAGELWTFRMPGACVLTGVRSVDALVGEFITATVVEDRWSVTAETVSYRVRINTENHFLICTWTFPRRTLRTVQVYRD